MKYSRNLSKAVSLAMAMLIALMPIAGAARISGYAVATMSTLDIEASLPQYAKSPTIVVEGRTKPLASVHVYVNDARVRVGNAANDGTFKFTGIPIKEGENTVRLEPHEGTATGTVRDYKVTLDTKPPVVKYEKEIPASTTANSITISGDVNEHVTIKYRAINKQDTKAPDLIGNLRVNKAEQTAMELVWDPSTATDLKEYLVERNGRRIAISSVPTYRDINLKPGTEYSYSVSAVDTSCNVGVSADILTSTKTGGNATAILPPEVNLSCETPYQVTTAGSPFSITIPLIAGNNEVEVIFEDAAGNRETFAQTVRMDNAGPKFLETNLDKISPSYIPDVTIKGKLDEQATVFVFINDEKTPSEHKVTDADGSFSIKTKLRTDVRIKKGPQKTTVEVGEGWANKIRLEAIDLAGNKATFGPHDVDFLLCGLGTWWIANVGEALPNIMLPRLMIQGIQQIGIPFNISYIGSNTVKLGRVDVRPIMLAKGGEKDYDHDWVNVQSFTRVKGPKDTVGYVQIQFENVEPLPDSPDAGPNEKERALSKHRIGECLVPGVGCVKLFLQMEIQFQEIMQIRPTDPKMPVVTPQIIPRTQKVCLPIEVAIDQTIPNDIIPKGMLRQAVALTGKAINLIDKVLKPITTIGEYVLYGCLASNVWLMFNFFSEKLACEGTALTGGWNPAVAEAGICDAVYGSGAGQKSDATKKSACDKCQKTIESRKKFETDIMHGLCDRIGCPSAPTLSYYIKGQVGNAQELGIENVNSNPELAKWAVDGRIYSGNDCAFSYRTTTGKGQMDYITPTYVGSTSIMNTVVNRPQGISDAEYATLRQSAQTPYNKLGIKELFGIAKGNTPTAFPSGPDAKECKKTLHPAHPNCCGLQYQREWSSACGVGTTLGADLDLFDELKESTCLAAQQANSQDMKDLKCNALWNSVAGFCEGKTGTANAVPISLDAVWSDGPLPTRPGADNNEVFLFVIPRDYTAGRTSLASPAIPLLGGGGTTPGYSIYAGYASRTPTFERMSDQEKGITARDPTKLYQYKLNSGLTAAFEVDVSSCFGQGPVVRAEKSATAEKTDQETQIACLNEKLCKGRTDSGYTIKPCERANLQIAWQKINDIVAVPDQQYIVRPMSGFLRSIQCVCLPAVTSYLHMWRSVLGAFHACFTKILLTGEGSAGFCAAKLSGTICDLLYEAISCFTEKFNSPGVGERAEGDLGFGNILGAMTGAGTAVSRSVTERYGTAGPFQSLFSERKLVHAICIWAFTGTWDLNMQGLFQQQVEEIPVDTEGALTTCERTFISYDPTTSPSGLTTWAYRIAGGLIAGADVRYRLVLKCSSGFNCDPRTYVDGKCDCSGKEQVIPISSPELGRGMAKKFDLVNFDAPFVVSPQNSYDMAGYRYDAASLEWDWTDLQTKQQRTGKAECSIRETMGGNAPVFCALDAFSGKFRCMFGEQESGIRITDPQPLYPDNQSVFALTDSLNFTMNVKQKFPEEKRAQTSATKFMTYEIRDAAGKVVEGSFEDGTIRPLQTTIDDVSSNYRLATNGVYTERVPEPVDETPLAKFKLNEDTIKRHSLSTTEGVQQRMWGVDTLKRFVTFLNVKEGNLAATAKYRFLINFPDYGKNPTAGDAKYEIRLINPSAPDTLEPTAQKGWLNYAGEVLATGQQSTELPTNDVSFTYKSGFKDVSGSIQFSRIVFNVNALQILVTYTPPEDKAGTAGCNADKTLTWKAIFTVYDADRQGRQTEQVSTDPETGEQQQKQVTFQVRCASKSQVAKITVAPVAFEAAVTGLIALINKAKTDEQTALNEIASMKTRQDVAKITTYLKALAQNERDALVAINVSARSIKDEARRTSVQNLPLISALEPAAKSFEASIKVLEAALPGDIATRVNEELAKTETTLKDLQSKKDDALARLSGQTVESLSYVEDTCKDVKTIASAATSMTLPTEMYGRFKEAGYDTTDKIKAVCGIPQDYDLKIRVEPITTATTSSTTAAQTGGTAPAGQPLPAITYETAPSAATVKQKLQGQVAYIKLANTWSFTPNVGAAKITFEPGTQIKFIKTVETTETAPGFWTPQAYANPGQANLVEVSTTAGVYDLNMISFFADAGWAFIP